MKLQVITRATILVTTEIETTKEEAAVHMIDINEYTETQLERMIKNPIKLGKFSIEEVEVDEIKVTK